MQTTSQADKRKDRILKDQHDRPWLCSMDIKIWEPTGEIVRAGWSDPLGTPQSYLRMTKDEFGQQAAGLRVDYDAWIRDLAEADRIWRSRYNLANRKFPADMRSDENLEEFAGGRPWPPLEAVKRAKDGDPSALHGELLTPETYEAPKPKSKRVAQEA